MSPSQTKQARKAHNDLWTAIWSGRVVPPTKCEQCGGGPSFLDKIQGHHDDYSKPLDVRWLCRSCHSRHHAAERKRRRAA